MKKLKKSKVVLSSENIDSLISSVKKSLDKAVVPQEGRILWVSYWGYFALWMIENHKDIWDLAIKLEAKTPKGIQDKRTKSYRMLKPYYDQLYATYPKETPSRAS